MEKSDHFLDAVKTAVATSIDTITFQDISIVSADLYCPASASAPAPVPIAAPNALGGRRLLWGPGYRDGPSRALRGPTELFAVSAITRLRVGDEDESPEGQGLGGPEHEAPGLPDLAQGSKLLLQEPAGWGGLEAVRRISRITRHPDSLNFANGSTFYGSVAASGEDWLQTGGPSASERGDVLLAGPFPGPQGPRLVPRRMLAQGPAPSPLLGKGDDTTSELPPGCVGLNVTFLMTPSSPDHLLKSKVGPPCLPRLIPYFFF